MLDLSPTLDNAGPPNSPSSSEEGAGFGICRRVSEDQLRLYCSQGVVGAGQGALYSDLRGPQLTHTMGPPRPCIQRPTRDLVLNLVVL